MKESTGLVQLAPEEEARRLWTGAEEALGRAPDSFVALTQALDLGIRAAEIRATLRLQPVRHRYPVTIGALLEESPPDIHIARDAIHVPRSIRFLDILDLLGQEHLPCVSPQLHRGWEDPRVSCARSRRIAHETTGLALDGRARDALLLLLACRNRIFRLPPPVAIPAREVLEAFPELTRVVGALEAGTGRKRDRSAARAAGEEKGRRAGPASPRDPAAWFA